jgi:hypothetical protein
MVNTAYLQFMVYVTLTVLGLVVIERVVCYPRGVELGVIKLRVRLIEECDHHGIEVDHCSHLGSSARAI